MSDPQQTPESEFELRSRALLDAGTDRLDGATRSRLTQARHAALAQLDPAATRRSRLIWVPAAGAAAVALAVLITRDPSVPADAPALRLEDLEIVAQQDDLELLEEMEFYAWISDETVNVVKPSG